MPRDGLLLIIDPQIDFLPPTRLPNGQMSKPTLPVSGALGDMKRIIELIESPWFEENIEHVVISQDWHEDEHVANASAWVFKDTGVPVSKEKNFPQIYRDITSKDPYKHSYRLTTGEEVHYKNKQVWHLISDYFKKYHSTKDTALTLWPDHCIQNSDGAEIYAPLLEALEKRKKKRGTDLVETWRKGHINETEFFSALLPEDKTLLETDPNVKQMIVSRFNTIKKYKNVYVCGEAKTHCVANTVYDLYNGHVVPSNGKDGFIIYKELEINRIFIKIYLLEDMTSSIKGFERTELFDWLENKVPKYRHPLIRRPFRVAVMGDIEGSLARIEHFVQECKEEADRVDCVPLLTWSKDKNQLILENECELVVLGDLTDKGPNNLKVLDLIYTLKRTYGKRVHIILGNRDLNKLRLRYELSHEIIPDEKGNQFRFKKWDDQWKKNVKDYTKTDDIQSKITKLKFIFKETMNSLNLFEFIRQELSTMYPKKKKISDRFVYRYYMEKFIPDLINLMRCSKLVDVIGDTIFAHGGVLPYRYQWYETDTLETIFKEINGWAAYCLKFAYSTKPDDWPILLRLIRYAEGGGVIANQGDKQPMYSASNVLDYIVDNDKKNPQPYDMIDLPNTISVVQVRWWDKNYEMAGIGAALAGKMYNEGYRRICGGHSPVGQVPVIVQTQLPKRKETIELIMCDTTAAEGDKLAYVEIQYTMYEEKVGTEIVKTTNTTVKTVISYSRKFKSEVYIHGVYTEDGQDYQIFYDKNGCRGIKKKDKQYCVGETEDASMHLWVQYLAVDPNNDKDNKRTWFNAAYSLTKT